MGHPFHICDLDLHPRKAGPPAAARTSGLVHASNRSAGSAAPPGIRSIRRLQRGWLRRARTACPPLGGCGSHAHGGACATRHPVVRELGDIEFRNLSLPSGKCRDPSLGVARERATSLPQDDNRRGGYSFPTFPHRTRKDGAPFFLGYLELLVGSWLHERGRSLLHG